MKKLFAILMSIMMIACFMPTMAFADGGSTEPEATSIGISKATLHDTRLESTDELTKAKGIADDDLFDTYNVSDNGSTITITVKNLAEHQNGDSPVSLGKWVGFVLPVVKANENKQLWYKYNTDDSYKPLTTEQIATELKATNQQGIAFYFNLAGNQKNSFSYYFGNETEDLAKAKTLSITINATYDHPNEVIVAPLVDKANPPETHLYDRYDISYNNTTGKATITVKNLKEHTNDQNLKRKWVGIAVPVEANVKEGVSSDGIIYKLNDGKENNVDFKHMEGGKEYDERWTKDGKQYISFYFDAETQEGVTLRYAFRNSGSDQRTEFKTVDAKVKFEQDAPTFNVNITSVSNISKTENSGDETQTNLSGAMIPVVYEAENGYYFPEGYSVEESNGITVTRNSFTQITVSGTPTADATITLVAPTAKVAAETPEVTFTATGYDTGKLTKVESGLKYKIGDGNWTDINGTEEVMLSNLAEGKLLVVRKGGDTTLDSSVKEITIERQTKPEGLAVTQPAATDGKGSIATTTAHEWTLNESQGYTACTGTLKDLNPGTYHIRVKAAGNKLASECAEYEIKAYTEPAVATAAIDAVTISGKRGTAIKDTDIKITLKNEAFKEITAGTVVTDWINLPAGLTAKIKDAVAENTTTATITISGTATVACNNVKLQVKIPATSLKGGKELTVSENEKAVFAITNPSSGGGSYYPYTPSTPSTPSTPAAPNLDKTKTDSTTALNAAATANKYDAAEQAEVKKILDKANADIKNAKTEAEVKAIEEAAQAEIDKILTTEEKATVAALDNVEKRDFETKSKVITRKSGKKVIRLTWTAPDGVDVDGYEIFRSTKKNSGFGTKPYFETTSTSYTNTKNLKPGKIYYYKVRAFVVINGERVYTDYSMKAFRTIK